jgi:hypothetical protein
MPKGLSDDPPVPANAMYRLIVPANRPALRPKRLTRPKFKPGFPWWQPQVKSASFYTEGLWSLPTCSQLRQFRNKVGRTIVHVRAGSLNSCNQLSFCLKCSNTVGDLHRCMNIFSEMDQQGG